eukprot:171998-Rhodomonas_salina.2
MSRCCRSSASRSLLSNLRPRPAPASPFLLLSRAAHVSYPLRWPRAVRLAFHPSERPTETAVDHGFGKELELGGHVLALGAERELVVDELVHELQVPLHLLPCAARGRA